MYVYVSVYNNLLEMSLISDVNEDYRYDQVHKDRA